MERALGVRLFDRTTRRVVLTQAGERYLARCGDLVDQARIAHEALRESTEHPVGLIQVSMSVDLGIHHIGPLLPEFARLYPGIRFAFDLSPVNRDLLGDQFDVAIRIGPTKGDLLVTRRTARVAMCLYAGPGYLDRHGAPRQPADLAAHECLTPRAAP
jgi:DNA-binding transcriptional LysR family regulator